MSITIPIEEVARMPRPGWAMVLPLVLFAAACVIVGATPGGVAGVLSRAVSIIAPTADVQAAQTVLKPLAIVAPLLAAVMALLFALRRWAGRRPAEQGSTWACGYAAPTVAMQYTATSFAEPMTRILQPLLQTEVRHRVEPARTPVWPRAVHWASRTADRVLVSLYVPLFGAIARAGGRLRGFHQGRVTGSLLYIGATVLVMLTLLFFPGARR